MSTALWMGYHVNKFMQKPPQPDFGISSIPEAVSPVFLILSSIVFVIAIACWGIFFIFSDKIPTKSKTDCI